MSPTPSASRSDLISRAASRNSVDVGADRAAQPEQSGAAVVVVQPRRVQPVVLRRRAEVPDVRIAVAGEQRIARQLVARPLADHGARGVADVVLVEAQQRAEPRLRERGARAREAVVVQPAEIDALLEVDLRVAGRLQRPVPAVMRIDVVRPDDLRLAALFLRHAPRSALAERLLVVGEVDVLRRIVSVFCGTAVLAAQRQHGADAAESSARSRASPPLSASSRSYDCFASAGVMSRMLATSSASTISRLARS